VKKSKGKSKKAKDEDLLASPSFAFYLFTFDLTDALPHGRASAT
jgi:hypothetical protein